MGDWPIIYPKRKLNPDFRLAVRTSMANAHKAKWEHLRGQVPTVRGLSGTALATLSGFTHQSELSRVLNAETIGASPRIMARLKALAQAIGFEGYIFADQQPIVEVKASEQGATK